MNVFSIITRAAREYLDLSISGDLSPRVHADIDARLRGVLTTEQYARLPDTCVGRAYVLLGILVGDDPIE